MRDRVQYHNPKKMGEFRPKQGRFLILTNKSVNQMVGDRVWLVSRKAESPQYFLCETFVVENVGLWETGGFRNYAEAFHGKAFYPPVRFDLEPWFDELLKRTGNFGLGLQTINDKEVIAGLRQAAQI